MTSTFKFVFSLHGIVADEAPREKGIKFSWLISYQYHAEMHAEQMINKILDDNKGDSPEFCTYWPLTSYIYRSKFLTGALILLRKDCVLPLLVSFRITASLLILDLFILSKTLFGERVFRIFD